jgi:hypothetical protein
MSLFEDPIVPLNSLIPCFRKVVKDFGDNGEYWLLLHFYEGGLRTPRIQDQTDKLKVKSALSDFLKSWGKPAYTGQVAFRLKHAEFLPEFQAYPGRGKLDPDVKEGALYRVDYRNFYNGYPQDIDFIQVEELIPDSKRPKPKAMPIASKTIAVEPIGRIAGPIAGLTFKP